MKKRGLGIVLFIMLLVFGFTNGYVYARYDEGDPNDAYEMEHGVDIDNDRVGTSIIDGDPVLINPGFDANNVDGKIKDKVGSIWATIAVLVQIASVACVVFAGLRYMFASADQKADIKQGLIYLSIGAILVFGAITIIQFVVNATGEIL